MNKPTLNKPITDQSKNFERNFSYTMDQHNVNINETDNLLNEREKTLKKKIFSLPKMEALVHPDPKLSTIYKKMAEDGEEKYGYHYNETIMNIIFNDYILNSPKYLQKYKMVKPKEKKRRDKTGIRQLQKAATDKQDKEKIKKDENMKEINEESEIFDVKFLVHPDDSEVFAYFPNENYDKSGKYRMGYAHIGQHTAVDPEYAKESRLAKPNEFNELKNELESNYGYKLNIISENAMSINGKPAQSQSTMIHGGKVVDTGKGEGLSGTDKKLKDTKVKSIDTITNETTSTGGDGAVGSDSATGSGEYYTPKAWGSGDLMKTKKENKILRKPVWRGGTIVQEQKENYLINPIGFERIHNYLNETVDFNVNNIANEAMKSSENKLDEPKLNTQTFNVGDVVFDKLHDSYGTILDNYNNPKFGDKGDVRLDSDGNVPIYTYDDNWNINGYNLIKVENENIKENKNLYEMSDDNMIKTKEEIKNLGRKITGDDIPKLAGEALYHIAINLANKMLPLGWDDLPDINSMWDYIDERGGMSKKELINSVKEAVNERLSEEGMGLDDIMENKKVNEEAKSKAQQRFMGMVRALQKGDIDSDKVSDDVKNAAKSMKQKDVKDFAKTKHDEIPEKVNEDELEFNNNDDAAKQAMKDMESEFGDLSDVSFEDYEDEEVFHENKKINEDHLTTIEDKVDFIIKSYGIINPEEKEFTRDELPYLRSHFLNLSDERINELYKASEGLLRKMNIDPQTIDISDPIPSTIDEHHLDKTEDKINFIAKAVNFLTYGRDNISTATIEHHLNKKSDEMINKIYLNTEKKLKERGIDPKKFQLVDETQSSIIDGSHKTTKVNPEPKGELGRSVKMGIDINETDESKKALNKLNEELNAFIIHHNKLKKISENRKPSSLVLKDRLGSENEKHFKKDMKDSITKDVMKQEKSIQQGNTKEQQDTTWKEQQEIVGENPSKYNEDIEKDVLKRTKGSALKNVGDSANESGEEVPKRNLTSKEQEEVELYRKGQQDIVYDNEPNKKFEERMKAGMGDELYNKREKKLKKRAEAPLYNKDPQPTKDDVVGKVQYNKEKSGWNEREGLKETDLSVVGRYLNEFGKKMYVNFNFKDIKPISENKNDMYKLIFTGLGNIYDSKGNINENAKALLELNEYYTNGKLVFYKKIKREKLNENKKNNNINENENMKKIKHLLKYNPKEYINTKNIKL